MNNSDYNYDCLVYFISCRFGMTDKVIYDSNDKTYSLESITNEFNGDFGKLYFVDCKDVRENGSLNYSFSRLSKSKFGNSRIIISPTRRCRTDRRDVSTNDGGYLIQIMSKVLISTKSFDNTLNNMITITKSTMESLLSSNTNSSSNKLIYDIDDTKGQIFKFTDNASALEEVKQNFEELKTNEDMIQRQSSLRSRRNNSLFSHLHSLSQAPQIGSKVVFNPLIVILGIGKYDNDFLPNLIGVSRDYSNIAYSMNYCHEYAVVYQSKDNNLNHKQGKDKSFVKDIRTRCKLEWKYEEIEKFNTDIKKLIEYPFHNYDGLIYFISCHGDVEQVIYDSKGEEFPLIDIFNEFDNVECEKLRNKPKVYIVDSCRGQMRTTRYEMETTGNTKIIRQTTSSNFSGRGPSRGATPLPPVGEQKETQTESDDEAMIEKKQDESIEKDQKEKEKKKGKELSEMGKKTVSYTKESDCRKIFANTEGYAAVDGGTKGGYLIRSFTKAMADDGVFESSTLDDIVKTTYVTLEKLIGSVGAEVIEDVNTIHHKVYFGDRNNLGHVNPCEL